MVPEQVWDWHFCSYHCVFFVFCLCLSSLVWFFLWLPEKSYPCCFFFIVRMEISLFLWKIFVDSWNSFFLWISDSANASSPQKCVYACGWRINPLMFLKVNFWWQTYRTEKWDPDLSHYLKVGFSGIVFHWKTVLVLFELELHPIVLWRISRVYSKVLWILFVWSNS